MAEVRGSDVHTNEGYPRRSFLLLVVISGLGSRTTASLAVTEPQRYVLDDTGRFPNSRFPALVYRAALAHSGTAGSALADAFERRFADHGWGGSWRNGLYRVHHYHSTAHEVLGVYSGEVQLRLGGPSGPLITLQSGDVAVLPAGVAHKNEGQSTNFRVLGAYPIGTSPDMNTGDPSERPAADQRIVKLSVPRADPVLGAGGPLLRLWR